jgi:hypothetical protein
MFPAFRPATIWEGRGGGSGLTTVGGGVDPPGRIGRTAANPSWAMNPRPVRPMATVRPNAFLSALVAEAGVVMAEEACAYNSVFLVVSNRFVVTR